MISVLPTSRKLFFLSSFRTVLSAIHVQVTDRPSADAPSLTQAIIVQMVYYWNKAKVISVDTTCDKEQCADDDIIWHVRSPSLGSNMSIHYSQVYMYLPRELLAWIWRGKSSRFCVSFPSFPFLSFFFCFISPEHVNQSATRLCALGLLPAAAIHLAKHSTAEVASGTVRCATLTATETELQTERSWATRSVFGHQGATSHCRQPHCHTLVSLRYSNLTTQGWRDRGRERKGGQKRNVNRSDL